MGFFQCLLLLDFFVLLVYLVFVLAEREQVDFCSLQMVLHSVGRTSCPPNTSFRMASCFLQSVPIYPSWLTPFKCSAYLLIFSVLKVEIWSHLKRQTTAKFGSCWKTRIDVYLSNSPHWSNGRQEASRFCLDLSLTGSWDFYCSTHDPLAAFLIEVVALTLYSVKFKTSNPFSFLSRLPSRRRFNFLPTSEIVLEKIAKLLGNK